jgi:streptogramin lyase
VATTPQYAGGVTWAHSFTVLGTGFNDQISTNLAVGPDGNIWFGQCINVCGQGAVANSGEIVSVPIQPGSHAVSVRLQNFMNAVDITPGPGGNLYATATNFGAYATREDAVYVLSTSATILHKFDLPSNSRPIGIVTGSDHNLWIAEPGINKIARMTPTGVFTHFSLPTRNAAPRYITYGVDGALWFTETGANKIGRNTTTGSITEYAIPSVNSGAYGIEPCTTFCGAHGGVWFAEINDSKIGKFNAPI